MSADQDAAKVWATFEKLFSFAQSPKPMPIADQQLARTQIKNDLDVILDRLTALEQAPMIREVIDNEADNMRTVVVDMRNGTTRSFQTGVDWFDKSPTLPAPEAVELEEARERLSDQGVLLDEVNEALVHVGQRADEAEMRVLALEESLELAQQSYQVDVDLIEEQGRKLEEAEQAFAKAAVRLAEIETSALEADQALRDQEAELAEAKALITRQSLLLSNIDGDDRLTTFENRAIAAEKELQAERKLALSSQAQAEAKDLELTEAKETLAAAEERMGLLEKTVRDTEAALVAEKRKTAAAEEALEESKTPVVSTETSEKIAILNLKQRVLRAEEELADARRDWQEERQANSRLLAEVGELSEGNQKILADFELRALSAEQALETARKEWAETLADLEAKPEKTGPDPLITELEERALRAEEELAIARSEWQEEVRLVQAAANELKKISVEVDKQEAEMAELEKRAVRAEEELESTNKAWQAQREVLQDREAEEIEAAERKAIEQVSELQERALRAEEELATFQREWQEERLAADEIAAKEEAALREENKEKFASLEKRLLQTEEDLIAARFEWKEERAAVDALKIDLSNAREEMVELETAGREWEERYASIVNAMASSFSPMAELLAEHLAVLTKASK